MAELFFAIATIVIVALTCATFAWGAWLHHLRESGKLQLRREEQDRMFLLSEKMLEKNMLPPAYQTKMNRDY